MIGESCSLKPCLNLLATAYKFRMINIIIYPIIIPQQWVSLLYGMLNKGLQVQGSVPGIAYRHCSAPTCVFVVIYNIHDTCLLIY